MDLLLVLTYTAICITIFKVFKIPLNKWTVPSAVLVGMLLIGGLIFTMNYNHPHSEISREYFITTPIVPTVSGKVIGVPVQGNSELNKGDVLFQIDPTPYKNKVASLSARVLSARGDQKRVEELTAKNFASKRHLDTANAQVDNLEAQLATAEYELDQTTVRAPTDGYATQVILRPGMMAVNLPLRPVMIFVHDEGKIYIGWFRQNSLLRLEVGNDAEVAFDSIPGKVFSGKVAMVFPAIAEGQLQPSPLLVDPRQATMPGRVPVLIDIDDPEFEAYRSMVPGGAFAQTAIYSEHFHHVAIIRKVLLRMASWMNYLFPFH